MLISPVRIHDLLTSLLGEEEADGPHTALLITPAGQLMAMAALPDPDDDDVEVENGPNGGDSADGEDEDGDEGDEEEEEVTDSEPWLEGPERLRLLLGLASQWEEDESPRVECELGRLFLRPIPLPELEVPPPNAAVPSLPAQPFNSFVLVLNATTGTPWPVLAAKADDFLSEW